MTLFATNFLIKGAKLYRIFSAFFGTWSMTDPIQEQKQSPLESFGILKHEGIFLAMASGAIYVAAFAWESGYANFFRIPGELVSVNLQTILRIGAILIGAAIPTLYLYDLFALSLRKMDSARRELRHRISLLGIIIILGVVVPFALGAPLKAYIGWLMPAGIYLLVWMVLPLIVHREGTFEERWAADDEIDKSFEAPAKLLSNSSVLAIFGYFVLAYVFYHAGETWALSKEEFLVLDKDNQVLLLKDGDTLLLASFDPATRKLSGGFHIVPVLKLASEQFTLKKIGPLLPPKKNQ